MTTSNLAAIMREGMGKMLGGLNKLECQITGKIDNVRSDLRDTNTAVANLEGQFKCTNEDNNRRFEQLERFMHGGASSRGPSPLTTPSWLAVASGSAASSDPTNSSLAYATAISHPVGSAGPSSSSSFSPSPASRISVLRRESYWKARRSLFLWPIKGPDLKESVTTFLRDNLDFEIDEIPAGDLQVERMRSVKSKKKAEVLVRFKTVEQRIPFAPLLTCWQTRRLE